MPELGLADFADWVGAAVEVAIGRETSVVMTLVTADPLAGSPRVAGGFRLEFAGPVDPVLPQAIYPVTGPTGCREIFMVPVARDSDATRYEAVFY